MRVVALVHAFPRWLPVLVVLTATCTVFTDSSPLATQLVFTTIPGTSVAGKAFAPAVVVEAQDAAGRLASAFTGEVTVVIGANPSAGTLSGTVTVAAVAGRATFSNLGIDKVGSGYTLTASFGSLTSATSAAFAITAAAASRLVFTIQPSTTTAGASIRPAIAVTALDAFGNTATGFARNVTLAMGTNPTGAVLLGTTVVSAVAGVATFVTPRIYKSGAGYTLVAVADGVTRATSASFNVDTGPAATLTFTVQPGVALYSCPVGGMTITPFQLTVWDAVGNPVVTDTREIHIALGTPWGTLSGTTTAAALDGVATFSGLTIDRNGVGYRLVASALGLTAATSAPFGATDACWTHLTFSVQPTNTVAGAAITPAVTVTARDNQGDVATWFTGFVTIDIATNPVGGTLSGTNTAAVVAGVATFPTLTIDRAGTGYTLTASTIGLLGATSAAFTIVAGAATQLVCSGGPTGLHVRVADDLGNTVMSYAGNVTVALGTGSLTVAAVSGVATFGSVPSGTTVVVTSGALTVTCGPY